MKRIAFSKRYGVVTKPSREGSSPSNASTSLIRAAMEGPCGGDITFTTALFFIWRFPIRTCCGLSPKSALVVTEPRAANRLPETGGLRRLDSRWWGPRTLTPEHPCLDSCDPAGSTRDAQPACREPRDPPV